MANINLNDDGRGIKEPSGKKITASTLEAGKTYLHKNKSLLRTIVNIIGNEVHYTDMFISPYFRPCSKAHFASICPNEATLQEIEYIKNSY